jgi:hypothetical protein
MLAITGLSVVSPEAATMIYPALALAVLALVWHLKFRKKA